MPSSQSSPLMDEMMWSFPSVQRYHSRNQMSPSTPTDGMSQLSISSVSSSLPTQENMNVQNIRPQESPPKGLVQKRREQFNHSSSTECRPYRSRSVPISAVILSAQQPEPSYMEEIQSPTRKVQIDRIRYDFRAPAEILRKNPGDPIGDECCETTTTTERLSDGEKRTFRVIREVGDDRERRSTQPLTRSVVRAASHSAPRGFPIVTVSVSDPKSSRTRSTSEFSQHSAVIHVRDKDPTRPTVIPVTRSSPASSHRSPSPVKTSRPSSRRAVQVEQFDSKSVTIPAPTAASRHPRPREDNTSSSAPLLWTPVKRPPDERDSRRWQEIDVEKEISIREQELYIARQTIRKLSMDLARLERDKQQLEIEAQLQRQKSEAELASRVADAITHLRCSSAEPENKPTLEKSKRSPVMGTSTKFDPAAIKLECERMMAVLRQERSSEEELADASEVDREIERLKREVNAKKDSVMRAEQQLSAIKRSPSQSIASTSGEEDSDSSQILSVQDQVVMYNGGGSTGAAADNRTSLINKLERELTDAQLCNLRLNAKIGSLVSNGNATIKKEVLDLKVCIYLQSR